MAEESGRFGRVSTPVRLLLEGAMIVLSVLSALALDAAAEERGERRVEREYLGLLKGEFAESHAEVTSDREARAAIMARTRWLLDWSAGEVLGGLPRPVPIDSLVRWLGDLRDFRYYTPVQVVTEDLLSSGRFSVLQSEELRRLMLAFRLEEDRIAVVEARERTFVADRIEPVLARHLPLEAMETGVGDPATQRAAVRALFQDSEMRNLTRMRLDRTATAQRFSSGLMFLLEALAKQLESEMESG